MGILLEARGAAFGYRGRAVISDIHLALRSGELIGIAGPNGAGKSTLFRGLLGLIPPLRGSLERHARAIGYVPQNEVLDALYPLSALEVVCMGSFTRLKGLRRVSSADRELARACLVRVELPDVGSKPYASLSGGQRQRVLIARALMIRPDLMLLDEPTSGVDDRAAQIILGLLANLATEEGVGVAIVSHQLDLLRSHCSQVAWVADGTVRVGAPATILAPIGGSL
ncbi:MAG: metal ABC transporter ATP-binding protein [Planctomycetes bacterium]|nr:metal ABC transporter ATP-binding protein [Planctomycetota bacterium]MCB9909512.1 metal ABC transporter ATP-binding protein [Planctomycetota bacterium]MCB9912521.1 metal ABC transporter ATP-binding protein [Planctomycetota bacterium]HPF14158.1 metal ABC transporter ATP-binding protein [Planctomycetota bacterium]